MPDAAFYSCHLNLKFFWMERLSFPPLLNQPHKRTHFNTPDTKSQIHHTDLHLQGLHDVGGDALQHEGANNCSVPAQQPGPASLLLRAPPPPASYLTTQNFTPLTCCCSCPTYMHGAPKPVALDNQRSYALVAWQPQCPPPKGRVLSTSGCWCNGQQNNLEINLHLLAISTDR